MLRLMSIGLLFYGSEVYADDKKNEKSESDETNDSDSNDTFELKKNETDASETGPKKWYEKLPTVRIRPLDDARTPFDGLRLRSGFGANYLSYSQSSNDEGNTNFPSMGQYSVALFPFWLNMESMVYKDMIGIDLGLSTAGYNTEIAGQTFSEWHNSINIGLRYRFVYQDKWTIEGIGAYRTSSDIVFKYDSDDLTSAMTTNVNMGGLEVGAALVYRNENLSARALFTETFSPFPIGTRLHGMADYELKTLPAMGSVLILHADIGLDLHHFLLSQSEETVFIFNSNLIANVGAGILW